MFCVFFKHIITALIPGWFDAEGLVGGISQPVEMNEQTVRGCSSAWHNVDGRTRWNGPQTSWINFILLQWHLDIWSVYAMPSSRVRLSVGTANRSRFGRFGQFFRTILVEWRDDYLDCVAERCVSDEINVYLTNNAMTWWTGALALAIALAVTIECMKSKSVRV